MKRNLNLSDISKTCNFKNLKYNNEKFPGLFVKFETGTVILFHSGKLVIVGCKTEKDIYQKSHDQARGLKTDLSQLFLLINILHNSYQVSKRATPLLPNHYLFLIITPHFLNP